MEGEGEPEGIGCVDAYGLRRFLAEDAVPEDLLGQLSLRAAFLAKFG